MCCAVKLTILILVYISACQADDELRLYLGSMDNYITTPLDNATAIFPYLNLSRPTCIYTHGIQGGPTVESVTVVITTLLDTDKYNVVLCNWCERAKNLLLIDPLSYLLYNIPGAEVVGCKLGTALVNLIKKGLSIANFFLMGHSMGAQIMGIAGRRAIELGYTILKIIGLDPAGPGFTTVVPLLPTLDTACARIVVIIYTDPDGLGSNKATGHINSHNYAWQLIRPSLKNECVFEGMHATNGDAWLAGQGNPNDIAVLSVDPTPGACGSYFLRTVAEYPYCREGGIYPH